MTDPQIGVAMLVIFIFVIMLGFPIAFTLMAMGVSFGFYAYYLPGQDILDNRVFTLLVQKAFEVASNDVLISVPLFTFMGYIIDRADILDRMFRALRSRSAACRGRSPSPPWWSAHCGASRPASSERWWC